MISKETTQAMIDYMKNHRDKTMKENVKVFKITVQTYHNLCRMHGLDGKIGPKKKVSDDDDEVKKSRVIYKTTPIEVVQGMIEYMKSNRDKTMKENVKALNMSVQTYHNLCKLHGLDGRVGSRRKVRDDEIKKILSGLKQESLTSEDKVSDTEEYSSGQDDSE